MTMLKVGERLNIPSYCTAGLDRLGQLVQSKTLMKEQRKFYGSMMSNRMLYQEVQVSWGMA